MTKKSKNLIEEFDSEYMSTVLKSYIPWIKEYFDDDFAFGKVENDKYNKLRNSILETKYKTAYYEDELNYLETTTKEEFEKTLAILLLKQ